MNRVPTINPGNSTVTPRPGGLSPFIPSSGNDYSGGNYRGDDDIGFGSSSDSSHRSDDFTDDGIMSDGSDVVANLIISSSIYQQAYSIFSNDKAYGGPYLEQLKMIPYAHSVRDENFWDTVADSLGGTSAFEEAVKDAYNIAVNEIRQLLSQYYAFRNSLPSEQVQQMAEAGVNAALTGEGIIPSTMGTDGIVSNTQPSQSQYSNEQLSNGVSSFVQFIQEIGNLASVGFNAVSLMGMLDIAERDSLNKQELHDLMLSQLGMTPSSDRTVLNTDDPAAKDIISAARDKARVSAAGAAAGAAALDNVYNVPNLSSPDAEGSLQLSGLQVLNQVSQYAMVSRLADYYSQFNKSLQSAQYSSILSVLDQEAAIAAVGADISESEFNSEFFGARSGFVEGQNHTSISSQLLDIKKLEVAQKRFDALLSSYRRQVLSSWGEQIHDKPHLAPFFYKALFDFGMSDTFYHGSVPGQVLKYGTDSLNAIFEMVGSIIGSLK